MRGAYIRLMTEADIQRFESSFLGEPNSGCWLWMENIASVGYPRFSLKGRHQAYAHRISWEIYRGPIPKGMFVLHKCDTPACVRPDHLFLGTHDDNMADKTAKNRQAQGERHGQAKLTEAEVREIRVASGSQREIAQRFNIHQSAVSIIRAHKRWSKIP